MLREETLHKLKWLRLSGMVEALEEYSNVPDINELDFDERLGIMVDREISKRKSNKILRLLAQAGFSDKNACIENINYTIPRNLSRTQMLKLATCDFVKHAQNINIFGATGAGKSYLGQALGQAACRLSIATKYYLLPDLLDNLKMTERKGLEYLIKLKKQLVQIPLLIIDEWLLFKIDENSTEHLLNIIDRRYRKTSTIVISQFRPDEWLDHIPNQVAAEAIADRLTSNAHTIVLESKESMRKLDL